MNYGDELEAWGDTPDESRDDGCGWLSALLNDRGRWDDGSSGWLPHRRGAGCDDLYLFSDGDDTCAVCGNDVLAHRSPAVEDVDTEVVLPYDGGERVYDGRV